MIFKKNKKALSSIVTTLLMVLLTLVLTGVVYSIVNPLIQRNLKKSSICLELMDKTGLSDSETCYDSASKTLSFMVDIQDTEVIDVMYFVISNNETQKSFNLTKSPQLIPSLKYYDSSYQVSPTSTAVKMPPKKSGIMYSYSWDGVSSYPPVSIELIPSSETFTCPGSSDLIALIPLCS